MATSALRNAKFFARRFLFPIHLLVHFLFYFNAGLLMALIWVVTWTGGFVVCVLASPVVIIGCLFITFFFLLYILFFGACRDCWLLCCKRSEFGSRGFKWKTDGIKLWKFLVTENEMWPYVAIAIGWTLAPFFVLLLMLMHFSLAVFMLMYRAVMPMYKHRFLQDGFLEDVMQVNGFLALMESPLGEFTNDLYLGDTKVGPKLWDYLFSFSFWFGGWYPSDNQVQDIFTNSKGDINSVEWFTKFGIEGYGLAAALFHTKGNADPRDCSDRKVGYLNNGLIQEGIFKKAGLTSKSRAKLRSLMQSLLTEQNIVYGLTAKLWLDLLRNSTIFSEDEIAEMMASFVASNIVMSQRPHADVVKAARSYWPKMHDRYEMWRTCLEARKLKENKFSLYDVAASPAGQRIEVKDIMEAGYNGKDGGKDVARDLFRLITCIDGERHNGRAAGAQLQQVYLRKNITWELMPNDFEVITREGSLVRAYRGKREKKEYYIKILCIKLWCWDIIMEYGYEASGQWYPIGSNFQVKLPESYSLRNPEWKHRSEIKNIECNFIPARLRGLEESARLKLLLELIADEDGSIPHWIVQDQEISFTLNMLKEFSIDVVKRLVNMGIIKQMHVPLVIVARTIHQRATMSEVGVSEVEELQKLFDDFKPKNFFIKDDVWRTRTFEDLKALFRFIARENIVKPPYLERSGGDEEAVAIFTHFAEEGVVPALPGAEVWKATSDMLLEGLMSMKQAAVGSAKAAEVFKTLMCNDEESEFLAAWSPIMEACEDKSDTLCLETLIALCPEVHSRLRVLRDCARARKLKRCLQVFGRVEATSATTGISKNRKESEANEVNEMIHLKKTEFLQGFKCIKTCGQALLVLRLPRERKDDGKEEYICPVCTKALVWTDIEAQTPWKCNECKNGKQVCGTHRWNCKQCVKDFCWKCVKTLKEIEVKFVPGSLGCSVDEKPHGVIVDIVEKDGQAKGLGVTPGMKITKVDGREVQKDRLVKLLTKKRNGTEEYSVTFEIMKVQENDEGARVQLGNNKSGTDYSQTYYCGRTVGEIQCGPDGGPQCDSCKRFQEAVEAKEKEKASEAATEDASKVAPIAESEPDAFDSYPVKHGDLITEVNLTSGSADVLLRQLEKDEELIVKVKQHTSQIYKISTDHKFLKKTLEQKWVPEEDYVGQLVRRGLRFFSDGRTWKVQLPVRIRITTAPIAQMRLVGTGNEAILEAFNKQLQTSVAAMINRAFPPDSPEDAFPAANVTVHTPSDVKSIGGHQSLRSFQASLCATTSQVTIKDMGLRETDVLRSALSKGTAQLKEELLKTLKEIPDVNNVLEMPDLDDTEGIRDPRSQGQRPPYADDSDSENGHNLEPPPQPELSEREPLRSGASSEGVTDSKMPDWEVIISVDLDQNAADRVDRAEESGGEIKRYGPAIIQSDWGELEWFTGKVQQLYVLQANQTRYGGVADPRTVGMKVSGRMFKGDLTGNSIRWTDEKQREVGTWEKASSGERENNDDSLAYCGQLGRLSSITAAGDVWLDLHGCACTRLLPATVLNPIMDYAQVYTTAYPYQGPRSTLALQKLVNQLQCIDVPVFADLDGTSSPSIRIMEAMNSGSFVILMQEPKLFFDDHIGLLQLAAAYKRNRKIQAIPVLKSNRWSLPVRTEMVCMHEVPVMQVFLQPGQKWICEESTRHRGNFVLYNQVVNPRDLSVEVSRDMVDLEICKEPDKRIPRKYLYMHRGPIIEYMDQGKDDKEEKRIGILLRRVSTLKERDRVFVIKGERKGETGKLEYGPNIYNDTVRVIFNEDAAGPRRDTATINAFHCRKLGDNQQAPQVGAQGTFGAGVGDLLGETSGAPDIEQDVGATLNEEENLAQIWIVYPIDEEEEVSDELQRNKTQQPTTEEIEKKNKKALQGSMFGMRGGYGGMAAELDARRQAEEEEKKRIEEKLSKFTQIIAGPKAKIISLGTLCKIAPDSMRADYKIDARAVSGCNSLTGFAADEKEIRLCVEDTMFGALQKHKVMTSEFERMVPFPKPAIEIRDGMADVLSEMVINPETKLTIKPSCVLYGVGKTRRGEGFLVTSTESAAQSSAKEAAKEASRAAKHEGSMQTIGSKASEEGVLNSWQLSVPIQCMSRFCKNDADAKQFLQSQKLMYGPPDDLDKHIQDLMNRPDRKTEIDALRKEFNIPLSDICRAVEYTFSDAFARWDSTPWDPGWEPLPRQLEDLDEVPVIKKDKLARKHLEAAEDIMAQKEDAVKEEPKGFVETMDGPFPGISEVWPRGFLNFWNEVVDADWSECIVTSMMMKDIPETAKYIFVGAAYEDDIRIGAIGTREEVLRETSENETHLHNGVHWYFCPSNEQQQQPQQMRVSTGGPPDEQDDAPTISCMGFSKNKKIKQSKDGDIETSEVESRLCWLLDEGSAGCVAGSRGDLKKWKKLVYYTEANFASFKIKKSMKDTLGLWITDTHNSNHTTLQIKAVTKEGIFADYVNKVTAEKRELGLPTTDPGIGRMDLIVKVNNVVDSSSEMLKIIKEEDEVYLTVMRNAESVNFAPTFMGT